MALRYEAPAGLATRGAAVAARHVGGGRRLVEKDKLVWVAVGLIPRRRGLVTEVRERWQFLDQRVAARDAEFAEQARTNEDARRLTTVPGIGALNAAALVAAIGDVSTFVRGRDLAARQDH